VTINLMTCGPLAGVGFTGGTYQGTATGGRNGGYRITFWDNGGAYKTVPARADYYVKSCWYETTTGRGAEITFWEGAVCHVTVQVLFNTDPAAATLKVFRGTNAGTQLGATVYPNIGLSIWHCVEVYCKVDDSAGVVTVKVNGATQVSLINQDTRNAGAAGTIDQVKLLTLTNNSGLYLDDVVIRDDAWPGVGTLQLLYPTGVGSNSDWTPSAGNAYACVDDLSMTDYISHDATIAGHKHDFAMADLTGTYTAIPAVAVIGLGSLDSPGAGSERLYAVSGAGSVEGTAQALSDTTGVYLPTIYMALDPDTGTPAWTKTSVNALVAGVETQ